MPWCRPIYTRASVGHTPLQDGVGLGQATECLILYRGLGPDGQIGSKFVMTRTRLARQLKSNVVSYLFLLPSLSVFLFFLVLPILYALYLSLQEWMIMTPPHFVGLANYRALWQDKLFHQSLLNTVFYSAMFVPAVAILPMIVATILNSNLRGRTIFRGIYYIPVISATVVVALIWKWIYHGSLGLLNLALQWLGFTPPETWLGSVHYALPAIAVMAVWQSTGYYMVLYLAGLQSIPESLYEAAKLDGANRWSLFWHITLPLLRPITVLVIVLATIGSFQVFDAIYVMTGGGPASATTTIVWLIFINAFESFRMGYAAAMGYFLFIVIFALSLVQLRLFSQRVEY